MKIAISAITLYTLLALAALSSCTKPSSLVEPLDIYYEAAQDFADKVDNP